MKESSTVGRNRKMMKAVCAHPELARSHCPIVCPVELYEDARLFRLHARTSARTGRTNASKTRSQNRRATRRLSLREIDGTETCQPMERRPDEKCRRILNLSARTINVSMCSSAIDKLGVNNKISAVIAAVKARISGSGATALITKPASNPKRKSLTFASPLDVDDVPHAAVHSHGPTRKQRLRAAEHLRPTYQSLTCPMRLARNPVPGQLDLIRQPEQQKRTTASF